MCKPYTYRIKFLLTGQEYYGVCYGKNADPITFWSSYFTSSKIVKDLIVKHGIESFEIVNIKIHDSKEDALKFEELFLNSVDAGNNPRWLNRHNGGKRFCNTDESIRKSVEGVRAYYATNTSARESLSKRVGKASEAYWKREEARALASATKKERVAKNPDERLRLQNISNEHWGKQESRVAASQHMKNRLSDPDEKVKQIERAVAYWDSNIAAKERVSEQNRRRYESQIARRVTGDAMRRYYMDNPEARQRVSDQSRKRFSDPMARVKQSLAMAIRYAIKAGRPFTYIPRKP